MKSPQPKPNPDPARSMERSETQARGILHALIPYIAMTPEIRIKAIEGMVITCGHCIAAAA